MEYIYDPISESVTIISDDDAVILKEPFNTRREAFNAAKKYTNKIINKSTKIGEN